jgi:predicted dehydrogenase
MSTPLNAVLLGYGYAGKTFHAPLIAACQDMRLYGIVSSKPGQLATDWPQARCWPTLEQALQDAAVDLIVIATPNDLHFQQAQAALLAGKHVVVDKPFTVTVSEARQLDALASKQGLLLSVFHNRRWDADFLTLQQVLHSGRLGQISQFVSHFDRYRPEVRQRWREQGGAGSGLWYDLGPHVLDQALQLFGQALGVSAYLATQRQGAKATDYFHVQLRYPSTHVVLHGSCLVSGGIPRFAVHGDLASYIKYGLDTQESDLKQGKPAGGADWGIDPVPGQLIVAEGEVTRTEQLVNLVGDYRCYYQQIAAAIRGTAVNPVSATEAARVMDWLERAVHSAALGREVLAEERLA